MAIRGSKTGSKKKNSTPTFFCTSCGNESMKWFGQCPACNEWNSLAEAPSATAPRGRGAGSRPSGGSRLGGSRSMTVTTERPTPLGEAGEALPDRVPTGMSEVDRTLGGGLVPGAVVLLGGDPGVGKSTLAMQMAARVAERGLRVLYVTGEESRHQVRMRSERLGGASDSVLLAAESDVTQCAAWIEEFTPSLVIIDSIQTARVPDLDGAPGSVSQVRESGLHLHGLAKRSGACILLVGHVTKDGSIAGPRLLEHMVDTVLYLEGERVGGYRVLRAVKNRFGSTNEIGLFEMQQVGLVEVTDPSSLLVDIDATGDGRVVVPTIEGTRPLLLEIQALVTPASYGTAQRVATGFDPKRIAVLLAVLRKHAGVDCGEHDVFVNVASGLRVQEPAADLAVACAVVSSRYDRPLPDRVAVFGEVGLGGEVRPVSQADRRVSEAMRVGYKRLIVPEGSWKDLSAVQKKACRPVQRVDQALAELSLSTRRKGGARPADDPSLDFDPNEFGKGRA